MGLSWLHQLAQKEPGNAFLLLTDVAVIPALPSNVLVKAIPWVHAWFPFTGVQKIKRLVKEWNGEVLVSVAGGYPLPITIPEIILYGEKLKNHRQVVLRKQLMRDIKRARALLFPSSQSATAWLQGSQSASQLQVIFPVPSPYFKSSTTVEKEQYRLTNTNGSSYFMLTGALPSEQEFTRLLKAFSVFKKRQQSSMKLLIPFDVVNELPKYRNQLDTYKFRDQLILTGEIDTQKRADYTAAAYALIMADHAGITESAVMESLQAGTPLLVSRTAAAEALAGPAALYISPGSEQDLAEKMMLIYKDETLRNQLIAQGKKQGVVLNMDMQLQAFNDLLKLIGN